MKVCLSVPSSILRTVLTKVSRWPNGTKQAAKSSLEYESRSSCDDDSYTSSEHLRHQKFIMKSQRNALLIAAALIFYWLLYTITDLVVRTEQLNQRVKRLKNKD